jgi:hypothetical protein
MTDEAILASGRNVFLAESEACAFAEKATRLRQAVLRFWVALGPRDRTGMGKSGHIARKIAATMARPARELFRASRRSSHAFSLGMPKMS